MRNERTDKRTAETERQQIVSLGDTPTSSASHRPALRKLETCRLDFGGAAAFFMAGRLVRCPAKGPAHAGQPVNRARQCARNVWETSRRREGRRHYLAASLRALGVDGG